MKNNIEGYSKNGINIEMCNISLENVNKKDELLNMVYEGAFSATKLNTCLRDETSIYLKIITIKLILIAKSLKDILMYILILIF